MAGFDWTLGAPQRLLVDGVHLEAQAFGPPPGEAPTLVLLHEGLGCVALWRDFPQTLAARTGMGVFAWSRAGYGRSDAVTLPRPLDYMTREAVESLPRVLDAVGFRRGALVGHSDGATIAALYAGGVYDPRVRALVLMAPHFFTEPVGLAAIARARAAYEGGDLRARLAKYHDHVDVAFHGWAGAWLDPDFARWNVADALDYLRVPTLVIQGEEDAYGTARQVETVAERSYAPVEVEMLPGCGHAPHLEAPERTLDAIAAFCARWERIENAGVRPT